MWKPMFAFNLLNASLPLLVNIYDEKYRAEDQKLAFRDNPPNLNLPVKETFDFVIIGGGTAGLVLARRLSDKYRVIVLEAGGNPVPLLSSVYVGREMTYIPQINYIYRSIPQKHVGPNRGKGGIIESSGGKMLGGSSSHNEGHYERGNPLDYDRWANVSGDPSWRWENVLKYFLKSEDYHGQFKSNGQHKTGGLLPVAKVDSSTRDEIWIEAARDLGYSFTDSKGPQKVAFSPAEYNRNLTNFYRVSSYTAFIQPIENQRENLVIRRYSVASEILFEGTRAIGVAYERHKIPSVVFASKEVLLCAGAMISPMILIRSGIGPEEQLKAAKKAPLKLLPVGLNFQDHQNIRMPPINVTDPTVVKHDFSTLEFKDFNTFVETGKGPLADYGKREAFIASRRAINLEKYPDWPDMEFYLGNVEKGFINSLYCNPVLERPYSTGQLYYNSSANTLEDSLIPLIDYNFLSDPSDIDVLIESIEFCFKIVNTPTFRKIGARFSSFSKVAPACDAVGRFGTRKYWICYIKHMIGSDNHQVGSNRMGKVKDPRSVVDSKLKVLGVERLRVCDASIMPYEPSANLAGPIMMIAEKTADEILNDWSAK